MNSFIKSLYHIWPVESHVSLECFRSVSCISNVIPDKWDVTQGSDQSTDTMNICTSADDWRLTVVCSSRLSGYLQITLSKRKFSQLKGHEEDESFVCNSSDQCRMETMEIMDPESQITVLQEEMLLEGDEEQMSDEVDDLSNRWETPRTHDRTDVTPQPSHYSSLGLHVVISNLCCLFA